MTAPSQTARQAVQMAEDGSRARVPALGRPPGGRGELVTVEPRTLVPDVANVLVAAPGPSCGSRQG
jgi:hypothetical protein